MIDTRWFETYNNLNTIGVDPNVIKWTAFVLVRSGVSRSPERPRLSPGSIHRLWSTLYDVMVAAGTAPTFAKERSAAMIRAKMEVDRR